jgi:mono/diheme cytochrome c family protein
MAEQQSTSGLLPWLAGGLVVGGILLGLLIGAYEIGYHRGQDHARPAAAPTTTPTQTTPAATSPTPSTTTPAAPVVALAAKGKQLYSADGCAACHSLNGSASVGPTFKGLASSTVTLTTGQTVTADDHYLEESIRNPDAQIVKGYHAGVMPAAISSFNLAAKPQDIAALVAYIKAQR